MTQKQWVLNKTGAFLPRRIKVVPPNAFGENYPNKNTIISYLRLALLFSLSSDARFYTKFLKLKPTIRMREMSFTKLKAFSQPVEGARHTTLLYIYENQNVRLFKCEIRRLKRQSRFLRITLYFLSHFKGAYVSGQRLALGNQKFPIRAWLLAMCRAELSAVTARLMSKCL